MLKPAPLFHEKDAPFVQRVGSGKSLFYTKLAMYAIAMELQQQAYNGPVALSGVWRLDLVWPSPQSSL